MKKLNPPCTHEGTLPSHGRRTPITAVMTAGLCLFLLPAIPSSQAEFNLNFKPDEKNTSGTSVTYTGSGGSRVSCFMTTIGDANCGTSGGTGGGGGGGSLAGSHEGTDGTPFFQDIFTDSSGNAYYQVIIGDYYGGDNFVLEYIIKADKTSSFNTGGGGGGGGGGSFTNMYRSSSAYNGTTAIDTNNQIYNMAKPYDTASSDSLKTGTGTGNPTAVIMHQFMVDTNVEQIFLKDTFNNKPLVSQVTKNGNVDQGTTYSGSGAAYSNNNMVSTVIFDARALTHGNTNAIATVATDTVINFATAAGVTTGNRETNVTKKAGAGITNTVTLSGTDTFGTTGDYNYATDNQHSNPTAGRYTYTAGTSYGGSNGTYTYAGAAWGDVFNPSTVTYAEFCDATQNPNWSGNGACKNSDGTGGGGGWRGSGGGW